MRTDTFKVGDRVKVVRILRRRKPELGYTLGAVGVVTEVISNKTTVMFEVEYEIMGVTERDSFYFVELEHEDVIFHSSGGFDDFLEDFYVWDASPIGLMVHNERLDRVDYGMSPDKHTELSKYLTVNDVRELHYRLGKWLEKVEKARLDKLREERDG